MKKFYLLLFFVALLNSDVSAQCTLSAPTAFKSNNITNCSVDLTWKAVSGASFYRIHYRVFGSGSWTETSNITGVITTISGLISNTPYEFEVGSYCANGIASGFSSAISKTTQKCSTPVNVGTNDITSSSAIPTWSQPCSAGEYFLQYKKVTDIKWKTITGITSTYFQLTNLQPSTSYMWEVKAVCGTDKSSFGPIANFTTSAVNAPRKNLVFIMLDDARYNVTIPTGAPSWFHTPNINRIASEGANFKITIPTTSQCSPSRASCYTGTYPHVNGVTKNGDKLGNSMTLIQQILTDHGYYTGFVGKYGQYFGQPKGFNWWATSDGDVYVDPNYKINGKDTLIPGNIIDVYPQLAKRFLNSVPQGKSFVLFYFTRAPHDPVVPRDQDTALYKNEIMPFPENFKYYTKDYPSYYDNFRWNAADTADVIDEVRKTFQAIKGTDDNVDTLFTWLEERNWMDSTLIIFTSDNGMLMGEHKMDGKVLALEESIRVPLFIRYPQWFSANTVISDQIASNIDIAATILDYYDIPNTYGFQGIPLRKLATGELPRKSFLYEYVGDQLNSPIRAVRTLNGKYCKSFCDEVTEEYYDLSIDPHEDSNRIFSPDYQATIAKCRLLLDSLRNVYNDIGTPATHSCELMEGDERLSFSTFEESMQSQLIISPNLVANSFFIKFENEQEQPSRLRVYDDLNHEIIKKDLGSSSYLDHIDCSAWSNGIYLIVVEQSGFAISQKLVVSR